MLNSLVASANAMYLASVNDRATVLCVDESQDIVPLLSLNVYPVYDLLSTRQLAQSALTYLPNDFFDGLNKSS